LAVFEGLQVEREDVALRALRGLLIKTLPGLVAEAAALHLRRAQSAEVLVAQHLARLVVGDETVQVIADRAGHVEADEVLQTKEPRLRPADERAQDGVGLFDRVAVLKDEPERRGARDG